MTRVRTDDYYDYSSAVGRGWSSLSDVGEGDEKYSLGWFVHPQGIVDIYRQADHTRMSFACDGRLYHRSWSGFFGNRTLNRLARDFVRDVLDDEIA